MDIDPLIVFLYLWCFNTVCFPALDTGWIGQVIWVGWRWYYCFVPLRMGNIQAWRWAFPSGYDDEAVKFGWWTSLDAGMPVNSQQSGLKSNLMAIVLKYKPAATTQGGKVLYRCGQLYYIVPVGKYASHNVH